MLALVNFILKTWLYLQYLLKLVKKSTMWKSISTTKKGISTIGESTMKEFRWFNSNINEICQELSSLVAEQDEELQRNFCKKKNIEDEINSMFLFIVCYILLNNI